MLINNVKHLSLNCAISMGKYFGFLFSTFLILFGLTMGLKWSHLPMQLSEKSNYWMRSQVASSTIKKFSVVFVDLNQVKCVIGRVMDQGLLTDLLTQLLKNTTNRVHTTSHNETHATHTLLTPHIFSPIFPTSTSSRVLYEVFITLLNPDLVPISLKIYVFC